jgi:hypothetical protein
MKNLKNWKSFNENVDEWPSNDMSKAKTYNEVNGVFGFYDENGKYGQRRVETDSVENSAHYIKQEMKERKFRYDGDLGVFGANRDSKIIY